MKALLCRFVLATLISSVGVSCTTAYDAYGRPQQVVDPGAAVLGAAAVGLLAYGLASSDNNYDRGRRHYSNHGYSGYSSNRHNYGYGGGYSSGYRNYGHGGNYCHY